MERGVIAQACEVGPSTARGGNGPLVAREDASGELQGREGARFSV